MASSEPDPEHRTATVAFVRFSGTDRLIAEAGLPATAEVIDRTGQGAGMTRSSTRTAHGGGPVRRPVRYKPCVAAPRLSMARQISSATIAPRIERIRPLGWKKPSSSSQPKST
jgi:hypothetical protein